MSTLLDLNVNWDALRGAAVSKRELRKSATAWKNGKISMRQIDMAMGHGGWNGKHVDRLWKRVLGLTATVENGQRSLVKNG